MPLCPEHAALCCIREEVPRGVTPELGERDQGDLHHDGQVGHVENARPDRADADVQEVDHAAPNDAIDPIRCASRHE
jgi:hypothetical protein